MKGHVNASGFPLQIGIKSLVNETTDHHGWKTIFTEHAWNNPNDGSSGFVDLVLEDQYRASVMIVEAKRVLDTSWIFLIEGESINSRRHAKSFVFGASEGEVKRFDWFDLTLAPATPESEYCVIPGGDQRSKSLIERTASDLVSSTEGFALEEKDLYSSNIRRPRMTGSDHTLRMYFNVIVTTAKLQVCLIKPKSVSIGDGTIQDASFTEVPYLRFRKQLLQHFKVPSVPLELGNQKIARAKESTVFVVNSLSIEKFLSEFEIDSAASTDNRCLNF
jgi:hypothetical protein